MTNFRDLQITAICLFTSSQDKKSPDF